MTGCLAAAALVAAADPAISLARRATIDQVLDELQAQEEVDLAGALQGFERRLERLRAEGEPARKAALASLARLADNPTTVDMVLRVTWVVALADGEVSGEVRAVAAEIAASLRVPAPALESADNAAEQAPGHVIVVGNEKGGTGKSTTAIHLAIGLAAKGANVACIDMDSRQGTLSRFLANRAAAAEQSGASLVVPRWLRLETDVAKGVGQPRGEERGRLTAALTELAGHDVVVIDTPGYASGLAPLAYAAADVLVTPINDSFIDVDALADIDIARREVRAPSAFCRLVWEERDRRKMAGAASVNWIVARNRTGHLDTRNSREMAELLSVLSRRLGFRLQPGLSERVVFRGLFYRGLTLFDLADAEVPQGGRASLRHARREVGELLDATMKVAAPEADARSG